MQQPISLPLHSRRSSLLIGGVGIFCAVAGLWFSGARSEFSIAQILTQSHHATSTPFFRCADSFYWVAYAREMIDTGKLRVRVSNLDNAPYGRPNIGWASLNAWYLVAFAKAWSIATGTVVRQALPPAAMWANPLLYIGVLTTLLAIGLYVKNVPAAAAAVLVLGTSPRVYDDFGYAVPGHHGWHDLACFGALICLAAGMRKRNSRRWFVAAGLSAAIAIWIGATQQAFGLAAAGIGALAGLLVCWLLMRRKSNLAVAEMPIDLPAAECWRLFGITGAVAALCFYILEYAPGPFAMRLEVNHPVYAAGFLLGGEFLCRAQRLIFAGKARHRDDVMVALAAAAALAAIAGGILFGPAEWHTMHQPFIQRLHREIAEFQSIASSKSGLWILYLGTPMFVVIAAVWRAVVGRSTMRDRVALLTMACPCAVAIILSFVQLRWAGIAGASAAAVAATLFADVKKNASLSVGSNFDTGGWRKFTGVPVWHAASVCLSLGLIAVWTMRCNQDNTEQIRIEVLDRLDTMETARALQTNGREISPIAIFSDQKIRQAWIGYVTGIRGVGSLYWDNPVGIRDEATFLASYDEEAAHRIARQRGIKYVVTSPSGGSVIAYHYMWQGNKTAPEIQKTLAFRLAAPSATPPSWLQLVPTSGYAMFATGIRIYRVL